MMFDFSGDLTVAYITFDKKKPTRSFPTDLSLSSSVFFENNTRGRCDVTESHCAFGSLVIKPKL